MGIMTGFIELDNILAGGLQNGCLYVLAGRPSMGKTGMATNMIDHICLEQYRTVIYFSLEMSKRAFVDRIVALEAGIEPSKIMNGDIDGEEWNRISEAAKRMSGSKLIIDDTPALDVQKIRSKCLDYRKDCDDVAVIFVDYLNLISRTGDAKSRKDEISEIIKDLKDLARELDCPIVILSQIPRTPEYREDHRPILSDLVAGEAICQHADAVLFLYRDEYYNKHSERKGFAEVIVAHNSMGSVGTVKIEFDPVTRRKRG